MSNSPYADLIWINVHNPNAFLQHWIEHFYWRCTLGGRGCQPRHVHLNQFGWACTNADSCCEHVWLGSRLCGNSDIELARRISVSISSLWKPISPANPSARRQLRKQFCVSLAQASFHTAWDQKRKSARFARRSALHLLADIPGADFPIFWVFCRLSMGVARLLREGAP
jgi:hypothetical protein